jgi:hypothetical protein
LWWWFRWRGAGDFLSGDWYGALIAVACLIEGKGLS